MSKLKPTIHKKDNTHHDLTGFIQEFNICKLISGIYHINNNKKMSIPMDAEKSFIFYFFIVL